MQAPISRYNHDETTATDPASITGTTTSGTIATTSEIILAPSSTGYTCTNNEKIPFPADVLCDTRGTGADPNMIFLTQVTGEATIKHCRDVFRGLDDCTAFAIQPNIFCDLWRGRIQGTDSSKTDWTWYSLDCFRDLPELPTSSARTALTADTATNEVETSSTVLTTSSADLAISTETTTLASATTTAGIGCPDGFPSKPSCGVFQEYTGGGNYINDISGTHSVKECLRFCINDDTCTLFSHGSDFCGLWNGDFSTNRVSADWSWYELGCFCVERAPVD
ncbi:uncharacterized protein FPRO_13842 [Fusarium proliferatum ET1]|uniref:Apple domain-containing protein n=1 Tax=Fusarium proliferatum (strain ET1) TaxID=1227346 RepID=A0A1L7VUI1_FUSPR|nr:uncharacterized protein FPRO_13842 [Fusarium proliferatum ET1]CZR44036.1 uncharacterized protein FPRO_13842 [Fusarium proliferatum ET1]